MINEKWTKVARVPEGYLKTIGFGALKGKSDISPQWRIKAMTEVYGMCGEGWYHILEKSWTEEGASGDRMVFCLVSVFTKLADGTWSAPITGIGGNTTIEIAKGAPKSNDEGWKMAYTDALGTALKSIGVGSEIYEGNFDGSKYKNPVDATPAKLTLSVINPKMDAAMKSLDQQKLLVELGDRGMKCVDDLCSVDKDIALEIYNKVKGA